MPLSLDDMEFFGPQLHDICNAKLVMDEDGWHVYVVNLKVLVVY